MDDLLTSREVADLAGCTYRQLDYWCRNGWLSPVIEAEGSGSQRLWGAETVGFIKSHIAAVEKCPYHPHGRGKMVAFR